MKDTPQAADLNPADDTVRASLAAVLPEAAFKAPEDRYLEEPRARFRGQAGVVVAPGSVEEVSRVIRIAADKRVGVVPYGGGTGLVGGQIHTDGPAPIVLSLERMNRIRKIHSEENVLIAEAGVTIEMIQQAATDAGRLFPLSYASKGTAQIGGGLAVNSGGLNVLRFGTARDQCLGLEAVLPDGSIWHGLKRLRKDNTGYDLRNLLIGSEGTLGVITAAALRLWPQPDRMATAFITVRDPSAAISLLKRAEALIGAPPDAFELIGGIGLHFLTEAEVPARQPFENVPDWSVLIEIGTGPTVDPDALIERLFADGLDAGLVQDAVIAQSAAQRDSFWAIREGIPEANRRIGAIASHDIALPISEIPGFLADCTPALEALGPIRINAFGHLGDGNLHYNAFPPVGETRHGYTDLRDEITRTIHEKTHARGGTFSAEHGVGRLKTGDLARYGDPAKLTAMRAIKNALDPKGIMNPGALFSPPS